MFFIIKRDLNGGVKKKKNSNLMVNHLVRVFICTQGGRYLRCSPKRRFENQKPTKNKKASFMVLLAF